MPPLPADPAERDAELRRRFEASRADLSRIGKDHALDQLLADFDLASVNDLCGTGFTDLYAIGSDGLIAHWNGATWTIPEKITFAELLHASKTDPGELFLVGTEATIVTGQINTGFTPIPHQISPDVPFYCACQYGHPSTSARRMDSISTAPPLEWLNAWMRAFLKNWWTPPLTTSVPPMGCCGC